MKILIVSKSILPQPGGSSIIVENLAKNFSASEMTVFGSGYIWNRGIPDRGKETPPFKYFFTEMSLAGRGARFFNWFRSIRFKPLVKAIQSVIQKEKIDRVIGIYPNKFYCYAACLAAKNEGIPFYAYFHNTFVENQEITDPKAIEVQDEIFETAKVIFVMSEGMRSFYRGKYTKFEDKFIPLVHTFNTYPNPKGFTGIPGPHKPHYKLVAIGNFNESNIEATSRLVNAIGTTPKFSLSLFTPVPSLLLKQRGINTNFIDHRGFAPPGDLIRLLQEFDICVLTHGFTGNYGEVEYKTIFPTRTIPFLLAKKPIFAHSPDGSFLNEFVTDSGCAELVDQPSEEAVLAGLNKIADDQGYQQSLVDAANETVKRFYGPTVVQELKAILNDN